MEQLNVNAIYGIITVAILGGISIAAKETISNLWAGFSLMLNPCIKRGQTIEAKVQGEILKGVLEKFGLSRIVIRDEHCVHHLILISDLKKTTIRVLKGGKGNESN